MARSRTNERLYKVFMVSPDGNANRTIELMAESPDKARRAAERQADAIAEQYETDAYEVESVQAVK